LSATYPQKQQAMGNIQSREYSLKKYITD